ncbi:proprotein convertase P-domain-containing protein [Parasphingorhabdus halotolerans]|uniref:DUF11 domain-containing protein n=1 Tax=Parasphingorhabdus halotolerans TaxID=2725558 RepID=A0A6H2DLJ2_9SPHN|nr:proprotein convertase P-domain-containing protein [Parasphingorhabdus halotolerans]QJB68853.1 DUF11 domain-containing protein [Parasphingorhabdus halotolerans]
MRIVLCVFIAIAFGTISAPAQAQTVNQYSNVPASPVAIPDNACPATVSRTFTVGTSFTVADVDIGVLMDHTWRRDLRITLSSPLGTTVTLMDFVGGSADNLNVRFNDEGPDGTIAGHTSDDVLTPFYSSNRTPAAALSAFDGQNALGTWTLRICDQQGADIGSFRRGDLYITELPSNYADLSLSKTVNNATPANGSAIQYVVSLNNAASSPQTATSVVVRDLLPAGATYMSHTVSAGGGTYTVGTGNWVVPSIAPNQTRTLTINATVNATSGATVTNIAEITASSHPDIDSTVNNGITSEDDYASRSFTVSGTRVAGTPPNFNAVCPPSNQIVFDWNGKSWLVGSLNNSYSITGLGSVNYAVSTDVAFVTGSPTLNTTNTGGFGTTQESLFLNMNNNNQSDASTTVVTLPTAVPGLQFHLFDVDFGAGTNGWADKVTVTGSYNGATVTPILTNNIANYVVGNTVIGDGSSSGDQVNGNVVVTFMSPVDTVTFVYGNHTTAPTNPGNQFMNIYDFRYCQPQTTLSVTKISSVDSDPVNGATNPKAIPGATVRYCILMSNSGSATATSITATDNIPSDVTFTPGSMRSGTGCGSATAVEDDNATDDLAGPANDEADPFGASISGTTLTATAASLGPAASFALTFQAVVN